MTPIEVYQNHLLLKKIKADEWRGKCPFPEHQDDTPSFFVNEATTQYYCFGCGRSGNLITFLDELGSRDELEGIVQNEAFKAIVISLLEPISSAVVQQLHKNLLNDTKKLEYVIRERFISYFVIKKFLIGYDPETDRIAFPIKSRSGKFVNIKLHNSKKIPKSLSWRSGNGSPRLYPYSALLKSDVVITEGEFDCLLLHSQGINGITSTTGAGTWKREWNELFREKTIKILFDSDHAGQIGALKVGQELASFGSIVKVFSYDQFPIIKSANGKIDVTSFIKWGGDLYQLLGLQRRR